MRHTYLLTYKRGAGGWVWFINKNYCAFLRKFRTLKRSRARRKRHPKTCIFGISLWRAVDSYISFQSEAGAINYSAPIYSEIGIYCRDFFYDFTIFCSMFVLIRDPLSRGGVSRGPSPLKQFFTPVFPVRIS